MLEVVSGLLNGELILQR